MYNNLKNKKILIIGGSSGIGYSTAKCFVELDNYVIIIGRNKNKLESAIKNLGDKSNYKVCDCSNYENVKKVFEEFKNEEIEFDHVIYSAGGAYFSSINNIEKDITINQFNTRVLGILWVTKYAVPLINKNGGSFVYISGIANYKGIPFYSVGSSIDGAIDGMLKSLSVELANQKIRFNSVSPGNIDKTDILKNPDSKIMIFNNDDNKLQDKTDIILDDTINNLASRKGIPEEIAKTILTLCDNKFIIGQVIKVDGGFTC